MARLILQTILLVTLISAFYCAPQNPTTARNVAGPAIATLEAKPNAEHSSVSASSEEAKIRPARTPHHDGTDHDHGIEHPAENTKLNEHIDHGSSTTPKTRSARAAEEAKIRPHHDGTDHDHAAKNTKLNEHIDHGSSTTPKTRPARAAEEDEKKIPDHVPAVLKDLNETFSKPRTARAAEKDEKHEDSHGHSQTHSVALTKDTHEHKHDTTTGKEQARPARATEEEKKGAVHDQPIPIPPTLKEEHPETTHTEEKKETPKHKREAHEENDSKEDKSEESPLTYTKTNSEQNEGDGYFALPNKESEYDRHV